jgi:TPR repeat protein
MPTRQIVPRAWRAAEGPARQAAADCRFANHLRDSTYPQPRPVLEPHEIFSILAIASGVVFRLIRQHLPFPSATALAGDGIVDARATHREVSVSRAGWVWPDLPGVFMPVPRCSIIGFAFLGFLLAAGAMGAQSIPELQRLANAGDPQAQFHLGLEYAAGQNVSFDYSQALAWYRKAAEKGVGGAEYNLALAYHNGLGVAKDESESTRWYQRAAEHGIADAQFTVGRAYETGRGVVQDRAKAIVWYRKAELKGSYQTAELSLGDMYATGQGTAKDLAEAMRWYRKAAQGGNLLAQCRLASGYLLGAGVEADSAQAAVWFRKAAEAGVTYAQSELGSMYESGEGVNQDYAEAYYWTSLAASLETRSAIREELSQRRDNLISHLTQAILAQTQERVSKWAGEHPLKP